MQQQQISAQQQGNSEFTQKVYQFESAKVLVNAPSEVEANEKVFRASIKVIPKYVIYNSPIQVDIKGFSCLHNFDNIKSKRKNQFQMTESCLLDGQEKMEANLIDNTDIQSNSVEVKAAQNKSKLESQLGQQGEYFLQGSLVLFQIDQQNQQRLQTLKGQKRYYYPIEFTLPSNLPTSLQSLLLKSIHISIKYSLQLKFSFCKIKSRKSEQHSVIIPFEMKEKQKIYPFQQLVLTQDIRCYHQNGKKEDEISLNYITRFLRCLCPAAAVNFYLAKKKKFVSQFQKYDLYHLQLLAAVGKDESIYLTVRAYKDPDQDQLTQNRDKNFKDIKQIKQVKSMRDEPQDVSLASIKETERRQPDLNVQKVQVTMWGEITNLCKEIIFQKTILLTHFNYDMVEGQSLVQLKDYLQYTKSCHNQLFNLRYSFALKAFFNGQEVNIPSFETFITTEKANQLIL